MWDSIDVAQLLIEADAAVNARDFTVHGWTPLLNAASENAVMVCELLLERKAYFSWNDYTERDALSIAKVKGSSLCVEALMLAMERHEDKNPLWAQTISESMKDYADRYEGAASRVAKPKPYEMEFELTLQRRLAQEKLAKKKGQWTDMMEAERFDLPLDLPK